MLFSVIVRGGIMKKVILEICCGSADDVLAAAEGGADRAELNSALMLGGLTPSVGTVRKAKKAGIPLMVMIRPRDGGFCYSEAEFESMLEDLRFFVSEGVEGLVFGVLNDDGTLDIERNRLLVEAAGDRVKIFHRAFDLVPDWRKAMDELVELGFDRILTSGQKTDCIKGAENIKEMVKYAAGRIEILPGGGIRPENVNYILDRTGCSQLHSSASYLKKDVSCGGNDISFRDISSVSDSEFKAVDTEKVRAMLKMIK